MNYELIKSTIDKMNEYMNILYFHINNLDDLPAAQAARNFSLDRT